MRKSVSSVPQRATSFPSKNKRVYHESRKSKPRVSFSILPPTRITFESDSDSSDGEVLRNVSFNSRVSQFLTEKDRQRSLKYHQGSATMMTDTTQKVNEFDRANEMLMDIIEEIEADNISVDGFLRDAIALNLITVENARNVLDDFELENKSEKDLNNNFSSSNPVDNLAKSVFEQSITPTNKLLDLLSTLKNKDLTKCCKYTLGKLCQLTSFEDYEAVQKLAQKQFSHTVLSRTQSDEDSITSEIPDDSSFTDPAGISCSSSDTFDDSSGLGSEIDFYNDTKLNSTLQFKQNENYKTSAAAVKQALPTLIEGGVLKPIQVWGIIGSKDNEELLKKFSYEISLSLKTSRISVSPKQKPRKNNSSQRNYAGPSRECDETIAADLGYCSYHSELDSPTSVEMPHGKNTDSCNVIKKRPFTITSARSNSLKFNLRSSMPVVNQNHWRIGRRSSENDSLTCKGKCLSCVGYHVSGYNYTQGHELIRCLYSR